MCSLPRSSLNSVRGSTAMRLNSNNHFIADLTSCFQSRGQRITLIQFIGWRYESRCNLLACQGRSDFKLISSQQYLAFGLHVATVHLNKGLIGAYSHVLVHGRSVSSELCNSSGQGGDRVTWVAYETLSAMASPTSHFRCPHCGDLPRIHELNQK